MLPVLQIRLKITIETFSFEDEILLVEKLKTKSFYSIKTAINGRQPDLQNSLERFRIKKVTKT